MCGGAGERIAAANSINLLPPFAEQFRELGSDNPLHAVKSLRYRNSQDALFRICKDKLGELYMPRFRFVRQNEWADMVCIARIDAMNAARHVSSVDCSSASKHCGLMLRLRLDPR